MTFVFLYLFFHRKAVVYMVTHSKFSAVYYLPVVKKLTVNLPRIKMFVQTEALV